MIIYIFNNFSASKEAYRPPCARGQNITFKLHDDIEPPSKPAVECKYMSYKIYKTM